MHKARAAVTVLVDGTLSRTAMLVDADQCVAEDDCDV